MAEQQSTLNADLLLKSSDRDRMVNSLNEFNAILMFKPQSEATMSINNDLIRILGGLPAKEEIIRSKPAEEEEDQLMSVETDFQANGGHSSLRSAHRLADSLDSRIERLVEEKIHELRQEMIERVDKESYERDYDSVIDPVVSEVCDLFEDGISQLKRQVEEINERIEEVDLFRSKVDYTFKFKNLRRYFNLNNEFLSDFFWCQGIPFCINLKVTEKLIGRQKTRYLGFFLNCMNTADKTVWSIETTFRLIVPTESHTAKRLTERYEFTFSALHPSAGKTDFTVLDSLLNPTNGFVENETVKFRVDLEVEKIRRKKA